MLNLRADLGSGLLLLCWHMQAARERDQHQLLSLFDVLFRYNASVTVIIDFYECFELGVQVASLATKPT